MLVATELMTPVVGCCLINDVSCWRSAAIDGQGFRSSGTAVCIVYSELNANVMTTMLCIDEGAVQTNVYDWRRIVWCQRQLRPPGARGIQLAVSHFLALRQAGGCQAFLWPRSRQHLLRQLASHGTTTLSSYLARLRALYNWHHWLYRRNLIKTQ